jgi:hypothetical protein
MKDGRGFEINDNVTHLDFVLQLQICLQFGGGSDERGRGMFVLGSNSVLNSTTAFVYNFPSLQPVLLLSLFHRHSSSETCHRGRRPTKTPTLI